MRYSFHRLCFFCPEWLPACCSTASDELINIIKANLPHHLLPAKAGRLALYSKFSGRPGGVWHWRENQTWQSPAYKMSGEKRGDERKRKGEKWAGEVVSRRSTIRLSPALSSALEKWKSIGILAQRGTMITSCWGDELGYVCREPYLAQPSGN